MVKRSWNNKALIAIILAIAIIFIPKLVEANSFSVTQSKSKLQPGETATITVSTPCTGRFNITCTNGTVSTDKLWLENSSGTVNVTSTQAGTVVTITPQNPISTQSGEKVELGVKTVKFESGNSGTTSNNSGTTNNSGTSNQNNGTTTNTVSNNAKLSNLGITPYDFKGFNANTLEYSAIVPNNVTSVSVYANVQQSGAKYSVSGPYNNLQVGSNVIKVVVTAPDGTTTRTYKINVTRQAKENEPVTPNVIENNNNNSNKNNSNNNDNNNENETDYIEENTEEPLGLLTIGIDEEYEIYLEPEFKTDVYEYTINLKEDLEKIPLNAVANKEGAKVEITGNENLQEGENIIIITVTDDGIGESVEYKITVNKVLEKQEETDKEEEEQKTYNIKWLIMGIAVVALAVIIIITFALSRKRKKLEKEFGVEYNEDNYDENYFGRKIENKENNDKQPKEKLAKTEPKLELEPKQLDYSKEEKAKKKRRSKGKHF